MRHRLLAATAVAGALGCALGCGGPEFPPPESWSQPVADVMHGVTIPDPYKWLEESGSPATRRWLEEQRGHAARVLAASEASRQVFLHHLRPLLDVADIGPRLRAGAREVFTLRRPGEPTASIVARPAEGDGTDPTPVDPEQTYEVLVDPLQIRADGTTSVEVTAVSPDGHLLLYAVRDGGPDETEIRVLDLDLLETLPDRFPAALWGWSWIFSQDSSSVLYVHRSREDGPRARIHRFGDLLSEDEEIFGDDLDGRRFLSVSRIDDRRLLYTVQHGWRSTDLWTQRVEADGVTPAAAPDPLLVGRDARFEPQAVDGELWLLEHSPRIPNGRIVRIDLAQPEPGAWREIVGEGTSALAGFSVVGEHLLVSEYIDGAMRMHSLDLDGGGRREIELPEMATATTAPAGPDAVLLTEQSFLIPPRTWRLDLESGARELFEPAAAPFDATGIVSRRLWATSADGTHLPVFVVHREDLDLDGRNPTLLHGYGGFNVALTPVFQPRAAAWVRAGGVYAQAILRGGAEFGETWHRDGMLDKKQNVFDDFIAAAELLLAERITTPGRLAISGRSNGGLLVMAAATQRPDLFRAVDCGFPDLDMIGFPRFRETNNQPALLEYGDATIESQFRFLSGWSPYHAVRPGVDYPATILVSGDLDTRVPPAQARKMTARLQTASASGLPVILRWDERAGHAGGRPVARRTDDDATELAFLWWAIEKELPR